LENLACSQFRGHEDKIVTKEQEIFLPRRKFSRAFKIEAVRLVTERGVAVAQAARDLDLAEEQLRRWVRELTGAPQVAFPGNGQQQWSNGGTITIRTDCILSLGGRRQLNLPTPSQRAGLWRCAIWRASHKSPSHQTPQTNSKLDKTWGQGHGG
jgi:transposase-like protein